LGLARIYSLSRYLGLGVAGALNVTPVGGGLTDFHRVAVLLRGGVGSSGVPRPCDGGDPCGVAAA
jgi:hypothetical protein